MDLASVVATARPPTVHGLPLLVSSVVYAKLTEFFEENPKEARVAPQPAGCVTLSVTLAVGEARETLPGV
jgi:hypothetical protein